MLLEGGLDGLESRPRPARGQLWRPARGHLASRPRACVPPAGLRPRPARGENLPGVTLGALFHGLSHVLREVPQVSPALDKVPKGQQCPDVLLRTKHNGYTCNAQQHRRNTLPRAQ